MSWIKRILRLDGDEREAKEWVERVLAEMPAIEAAAQAMMLSGASRLDLMVERTRQNHAYIEADAGSDEEFSATLKSISISLALKEMSE